MRSSRPPFAIYPSFPKRICHQCLTIRFHAHPDVRCSSTNSGEPRASSSTRQSNLSERAAEYMDTLQLRALAATQRLNDLTGYSSIESLKCQIRAHGLSPRVFPEPSLTIRVRGTSNKGSSGKSKASVLDSSDHSGRNAAGANQFIKSQDKLDSG